MEIKGVHKENDRKEMRVGILTFHRAHNYGAVLQCYALQEILKRRGHDVRIIDYRQPWIEEFYKMFSWKLFCDAEGLSGKAAYIKKNLKKFLLAPHRSRNFSSFRLNFLELTLPCGNDVPQDFDCYVIGSDQLWSLHCLGGETDDVYFGKFHHGAGSRIIGYAVSADMKSIETVEAELPFLVSGFDALSMREKEVAERVSSYTGRPCEVCVDPTLLTDSSIWTPLINERWKRRKYVLVYEVRRKDEDKGLLIRKAEQIASRIGDGCEVIDLSRVDRSVTDFVSLFRYAEYVVTTSFHGCVFSILFERPFYALPLWNGYDLRYKELLDFIGASDRLVDRNDPMIPSPMDYSVIRTSLEALRRKSFAFIEEWI